MYLRGSTSNLCRLLLAGLLLAGCAPKAHEKAAPEQRGTADLDVLVRRHPGWRTVTDYDRALAQLQAVAARATPGTAVTAAMELPPVSAPAGLTVPMRVRNAEGLHLAQAESAHLARLAQRRSLARQLQIAELRPGWYRQARSRYQQTVATAQSDYLQRFHEVALSQDMQILNLTLQINALNDLVVRWSGSHPPAPGWEAARRQLAQKEAQRETLYGVRDTALKSALAQRDKVFAEARADRVAYVPEQVDQTLTMLMNQDMAEMAKEKSRLSHQRNALLQEGALPTAIQVPTAGSLDAIRLSSGPAAYSQTQPQSGLRAAQVALAEQRTRWIAFLYDDTRAAALDAAQERHWTVSFARPRPGETDLTSQMAQALATRVWKL